MKINRCYNCYNLEIDYYFSCPATRLRGVSLEALARLAPERCYYREPRELDPLVMVKSEVTDGDPEQV